MRRLFVVLAKVLGLLELYWGLTYLASTAVLFSQLTRSGTSGLGQGLVQASGVGGFALLAFGMAWVLLARTEWVADIVGVVREDALPSISHEAILRVGIKLVGIYLLAVALPALLRTAVQSGAYGGWQSAAHVIWLRVLPTALQIVLAVLLVLRTDAVVRLLARGENVRTKSLVIVGLALLALLILLTSGLAAAWIRESRDARIPSRHGSSRRPGETVIAHRDTNVVRDWEGYRVPSAGAGTGAYNRSVEPGQGLTGTVHLTVGPAGFRE